MYSKFNGLNKEEVENSRLKYGINEIEKQKKESILKKVIQIFTEPMFLLLIGAASVYFVLKEYSDGFIMLFFVLFISGIEFFQERKTDKALEALNKLSDLNIKVIRDGQIQSISSKEVVVNDLVILEEGDKIPADGLIIECNGLGVNESALTGESLVVYKGGKDEDAGKFKKNICYAGTAVTNGSAVIKIMNVGNNTEYGKIGKSLNSIQKEKTPLEKQIQKLIVICTIVSCILFILVIIINFFYYNDLVLKERVIHSILAGITVAMATIPEEIPVVLTVFLAMGAWHLTEKNTLTRNIKAVETLGAVTVLCTDKTGTLTQNNMEVKNMFANTSDFHEILALSCQRNPYDPMEQAIQDYCFQNGIKKEIYNQQLIHEYIFNNNDKMMGQVWKYDNKKLLCVKGAYENVLDRCVLTNDEKNTIIEKINLLSKEGYRVLAIAKNDNLQEIPLKLIDNSLTFVGLIALEDPAREGVTGSLASCYKAGIRVIMITGDNGKTAKGIADNIGLIHSDNVITGPELEQMTDSELQERVKDTNIFARVYPNQKMKIVNALQANGEVVAMTGDGVNDAPALKKADIGIAMGKRGTNVAKEAADIILMDDNFSTIVEAIANGRLIYNNIKKAISYILVIHIPIALTSLLIPLLKIPFLLMPIHIVLLELIIDPTSSIIFQRLKADNKVMEVKPRKMNSIINKCTVLRSIFQGFWIFIVFLGSYSLLLKNGYDSSYAFTFSFTILILANIFVVYVLQSNRIAIINFITNIKDKIICIINFLILLIMLLVIYVPLLNSYVNTSPLEINDLLLAIFLSLLATLPFDILKMKKFTK